MYSTDRRIIPRKPVISTLTNANSELDHWMKENGYHYIEDVDGLTWGLVIETKQFPAIVGSKQAIHEVLIKISSKTSSDELVSTGTLDADMDKRLILQIGDDSITFAMKPIMFRAGSSIEAKRILQERLPLIRKNFQTKQMDMIKRRLISRWIDQSNVFE